MIASYGKLTYIGTHWVIQGEPFVKTRLKRVFPRMPQYAADSIGITASPENSRELQWFLQRYPMDMEPEAADILERLARQHIETETRLADLVAGHIKPQSVTLALPAREYQAYAGEMLEIVGGYLLADDLGTGKTVSAICGMARTENLPVVVVCLAHLPKQWKKMIKKFAPELNTHILKKGSVYDLMPKKNARQGELIPAGMPDVIITSYHKLRGWAETLAGYAKYVVFDECQALRHPDSAIYHAAVHLANATPKRIGLSATPIYNYGNEFYHVLNVLAPGALGEYHEFLREWCTPEGGGKARLSDAKEFGAYLRREGLMLRRTRKDVGHELPPVSKIVHDIEADTTALDRMQGDAVALARIVLAHNEQFRGQKMQAAGEFDTMMRQATGIAKATYVVEFMKLLLDSGEPIVLFGWHRAVYDIWLEGLAEFNPVLYTGSESPKQKDESIDAFLSGRSQVLIMSLRAGAGVDGLQGYCRTVVFGELDWSPGVHEQCIGRVDRDDITESCSAYFLLSEFGSDPVIADVLGVKREQIENVRNPDMALAERIDTGENNIKRLAKEFLERRNEPIEA